jgi:2-iminobutanoate/2-iminopropanoate deaminase
MKTTNRRNFLGKTAAAATAVAAVPAKAQTAAPTKRVIYANGKKPEKPSLRMSATVAYGNLVFISGAGYHKEGDITVHTKGVLDEIKTRLESAGSSMNKVLKANVYLSDAKDYDAMNKAYDGAFGDEPPARTTIAAAWIPGNSLIEIDVVAYI